MSKTYESEIESELEDLISEANLFRKKEIQMEKFFNWLSPDSEYTLENNNKITGGEELKTVDEMMCKLEVEKDKCPELLEFYKAFEDLRDLLVESVSSEKKLAKACKEIFTGGTDQRGS